MSDPGNPNWHPLTIDRMPPEVRYQWGVECPDGSIIKAWVIAQMETQLDIKFDPEKWSVEQHAMVKDWLWFQYQKGDFSHRKYLRLETMLHDTLAGKVSALAQRHCAICAGTKPSKHHFPIYHIPIRIAPESRQSLNAVNWEAFQTAIQSRLPLNRYDLSNTKHLCIALTFVLRISRNDRDLDNMAKAILDAFSRALGFDDRHIHHLDLIKIMGDFEEEYVIVRAQPSYLSDHSDTIIRGSDVGWAGQLPLRLEDFKTKDISLEGLN